MGFRSLQHSRDRRSTCRGACQAPATFRPQGLATLSAAYSLRARAGLLSCRRRSWDSPFGAFSSRKVSAAFPGGRTHVPFLPSVFPAPRRRAGPTGRGFWAFTLPGVPRGRGMIGASTAGCSLGLCPLRVSRKRPRANPRPRSSHALRGDRPCDRAPPAPRSFSQPRPRLVRRRQADGRNRATLTGFLHRTRPERSNETPSGLLVHRALRRALLSTADALRTACLVLPEPLGP